MDRNGWESGAVMTSTGVGTPKQPDAFDDVRAAYERLSERRARLAKELDAIHERLRQMKAELDVVTDACEGLHGALVRAENQAETGNAVKSAAPWPGDR